MLNKPLQIGITGGIGSGKTLVTKIFSLLGVPIYDADSRAKWLTLHHPEIKMGLLSMFGEQAYQDNQLNSRYIAQQVFQDKGKLEDLNNLVHPKVAEDYLIWLSEQQRAVYIVKEAALLFESGSFKMLDKIIVVSAPLELRIERILVRDKQRTKKEVLSIIDKQMLEAEKNQQADFVIYNDETQLVIPQVVELNRKFSLIS